MNRAASADNTALITISVFSFICFLFLNIKTISAIAMMYCIYAAKKMATIFTTGCVYAKVFNTMEIFELITLLLGG